MMAEPTIVDEDSDDDDQLTQDDAEPVEEPDDEPVDDSSDQSSGDVEEQTLTLDDEDLGGDSLFDGVDDVEDDQPATSEQGQDEADDQDDEETAIADGLEGNAAAMEGAINEGMAQLGVFGLSDDDFEESGRSKGDLREEFEETFEAFRVGYFGSQVVEKYILDPADGEVSPAWGLAGSMLIASAMILWMRPDGDEKVERLQDTLSNISGGSA